MFHSTFHHRFRLLKYFFLKTSTFPCHKSWIFCIRFIKMALTWFWCCWTSQLKLMKNYEFPLLAINCWNIIWKRFFFVCNQLSKIMFLFLKEHFWWLWIVQNIGYHFGSNSTRIPVSKLLDLRLGLSFAEYILKMDDGIVNFIVDFS